MSSEGMEHGSEPENSSQQHKEIAAKQGKISIAIVTVSDSRIPETDSNFHFLNEQIGIHGHLLAGYEIVKDDAEDILKVLDVMISREARIIIFNGGTGISKRDTTYDALTRKYEKTLIGFGELFRMLSYQKIGSSAMFSRASAGVYKERVIISIPGSNAAVRLAWEKLILPEIQHLAWEICR